MEATVQTAGQADLGLRRLAVLPSSPAACVTKQGSQKYLAHKVKANRAKYCIQRGVESNTSIVSQIH
jgi:hypothetical protein